VSNRYCPECNGLATPDTCPICGETVWVCSVCSRVYVEEETLKDLPKRD